MKAFIEKYIISDWRKGLHFYTTWVHVIGLAFAGIGTGLALIYGAADQFQHSMLKDWQTFLIFFIIFASAIVARFTRQK